MVKCSFEKISAHFIVLWSWLENLNKPRPLQHGPITSYFVNISVLKTNNYSGSFDWDIEPPLFSCNFRLLTNFRTFGGHIRGVRPYSVFGFCLVVRNRLFWPPSGTAARTWGVVISGAQEQHCLTSLPCLGLGESCSRMSCRPWDPQACLGA